MSWSLARLAGDIPLVRKGSLADYGVRDDDTCEDNAAPTFVRLGYQDQSSAAAMSDGIYHRLASVTTSYSRHSDSRIHSDRPYDRVTVRSVRAMGVGMHGHGHSYGISQISAEHLGPVIMW